MKQFIEYDFSGREALVLTDGKRSKAILKELQLKVNYIDHEADCVDIHCGIPEEPEVLSNALHSLFASVRNENSATSSVSFPNKIRIKLSKEDIQKLLLSVDLNRASSDLKTTISSEKNTSNTFDRDFLDKIFNLMEDNMSDDTYWIDDLSYDMHVSRSTLFRKIKYLTGRSPQTFMRTIRLERALQLLEKGHLRIAEVAYQVGFSDPNYFSKCFRKFFGKSPSSFMTRSKNLYLQQMGR